MPRPDELYHQHAHRLYRACRARVAQRVSPLSPQYPDEVRALFAKEMELLRLRPPKP